MKLGGNWDRGFGEGVAAVAKPSLHHPLSFDQDAHVTLVYAGKMADGPDVTGLRSIVKHLARTAAPFTAEIIGHDLFGDNSDEPVLLLDHPQFKAMRSMLEHHNRSSYPTFIPHVAIPTLEGIGRFPRQVTFDRLGLMLAGDRENYWLGSGAPTGV